jgi:hypothetical protein
MTNKTQNQPPSLTDNLNQGFVQSHSQRINQHNLESLDQDHQLGADEAAASVIPQGNHKSKVVEITP